MIHHPSWMIHLDVDPQVQNHQKALLLVTLQLPLARSLQEF
jgi:hypothetical protein